MRLTLFAATLLASTPALAQQAAPMVEAKPSPDIMAPPAFTPAPAPTATVAPATSEGVLRVATPVMLRMSEELTTKGKKLKVGQRFKMEVAEAVELNGTTVIPAGSPVVGEITQVRNKGMWGKSGYIGANALYVRVNDRQIRLSGSFDDKGVTGTAGVVGAIALIPIAGFIMTGTSAVIPMGGQVKAFLDEDVPVTFSSAAPAPTLVVVPAAPVMVSQPVVEQVPAAN